MPREIACPRCGAPAPAPEVHRASTCTFCNATIAEPEVVERVVQRVLIADGAGQAGPRCPRCGGAFREGRVRDRVLRGCTQCGGLWIDNRTVGDLGDHTDGDVEAVAKTLERVIGMPMSQEQRIAELSCPTCAARMRRTAIPDTIHNVDVCPEHGTWFDRGELEMFARTQRERRIGTVTEDELNAAGVPGSHGFFAALGELFRR